MDITYEPHYLLVAASLQRPSSSRWMFVGQKQDPIAVIVSGFY